VADLLYPPVIGFTRIAFAALGLRFTVEGAEHIPAAGGAVLASNHVSYLDFTFCGLAARPSKRLVRFMAKDEVFRHPVSGPLMRGMKHLPVDRAAGATAYRAAVDALRAGEVVGVFPEGTISRSFAVKDLKAGAVRMAQEAHVPLIPMAVWGGQRVYTKGHPRNYSRGKAITIVVGAPYEVPAGTDPTAATAQLSGHLHRLVAHLQEAYPDRPADEADRWWLPAHLGGTALTLEQAAAVEQASRREQAAERQARRVKRG
jgi:1-acyl-sn-glycerol-3-phosphate acyltransferase